MINIVGRRQNLALVDIVDLNSLQNLSLNEMTDTALGHDGDRHCLLDALDHLGVAHARHTTSCTDVGGNALECHNGTRTCLFSDFCLLGCCHIHNHAAFQHLCQVAVQFLSVFH